MANFTLPPLTRRDLLRAGGLGVAGYYFSPAFRPVNVYAAEKVSPRGSARFCIFIMLTGGMSQLDGFDAKEGAWTPKDFDIRRFGDAYLPYGLFPQLSARLGDVTILRSMNAWDSVHGRAQYYVQAAHPLNLALAKEIPPVGSVVAYEYRDRRKSDDSLPPYVAINATHSQAGLLTQGFLSAEFSPFSLAVAKDGPPNLAPKPGEEERFRRRWNFLQELDGSLRSNDSPRGKSFTDYHDFYRGAYALMRDKRVAEVLNIAPGDMKRYGETALGNACALARNLVVADAGTNFVFISHDGWDFHSNIYESHSPNGVTHPKLCRELDHALSPLLDDLKTGKRKDGRALLDETLVVVMSEFGRTPGNIHEARKGREHYQYAACGLLAGGGVKGGQVIGKTDDQGAKITEFGWKPKRPIYIEDMAATVYSALGIDWTKRIENTPSGRAFQYIEPFSGTNYVKFQEVSEVFA